MKNFEEPIIVDALDCPEGVYLASGVTPPPYNPPTPPADQLKIVPRIPNHDTGTLTEMQIKFFFPKCGDFSSEVHVTPKCGARVQSIKPNDSRFSWTVLGDGSFKVKANNIHANNSNECFEPSAQLVFEGGTGAFPGHQGPINGESNQQAEAQNLFTFVVDKV